jgi:hypothetical protein
MLVLPPIPLLFAANSAGLCTAMLVALASAWNVSPRRLPVWRWCAGCASMLLFNYPNLLIFSAMALALMCLGPTPINIVMTLLIGAIGLAMAAWGGGIVMARLIGLARPALPRAQHAADWAGERVGARARVAYELIWPKVTVDSFNFSCFLVFTDSAAELLDENQLLALAVREIAFFKLPGLVGALRIIESAVTFFMLACIAIGWAIGEQPMLFGFIVGWGTALAIRPFIRRAHLKADALAAEAGLDSHAALLALHRQYELNLTPVVIRAGGTPSLYDRLVAAGVPPEYPRPPAPSGWKILLSLAVATTTCVILSTGAIVAAVILMTSAR